MGMGIVSNLDFESEVKNTGATPSIKNKINPSELVSDSESVNQAIIKEVRHNGRGAGNRAVPNGLRKIIGEESVINGRDEALKLASSFGISPSSVSAYANGSTSTASYLEQKDSLVNNLNAAKERVSKRARSKMLLAISHITPEKLADAKVRDLAGVARDMSAVIKNMEPDVAKTTIETNAPQFVFYAPQFRDERSFDVVTAKE